MSDKTPSTTPRTARSASAFTPVLVPRFSQFAIFHSSFAASPCGSACRQTARYATARPPHDRGADKARKAVGTRGRRRIDERKGRFSAHEEGARHECRRYLYPRSARHGGLACAPRPADDEQRTGVSAPGDREQKS